MSFHGGTFWKFRVFAIVVFDALGIGRDRAGGDFGGMSKCKSKIAVCAEFHEIGSEAFEVQGSLSSLITR